MFEQVLTVVSVCLGCGLFLALVCDYEGLEGKVEKGIAFGVMLLWPLFLVGLISLVVLILD